MSYLYPESCVPLIEHHPQDGPSPEVHRAGFRKNWYKGSLGNPDLCLIYKGNSTTPQQNTTTTSTPKQDSSETTTTSATTSAPKQDSSEDTTTTAPQQESSEDNTPTPILTNEAPQTTSSEDKLFYHWILGLNAQSPMTLGAYVNDLTKKYPPFSGSGRKGGDDWATWFSNMWAVETFVTPSVENIHRAKIFVYNFLSKVDIVCDVRLPGTVSAKMIDEEGNETSDIPDEIWRETALCSVIRYFAYRETLPMECDSIRVLPIRTFVNPNLHSKFKELINNSLRKSVNSGTHFWFQRTETTIYNNQFIVNLLKYLTSFGLNKEAQEMYSEWMEKEPAFAVHVANLLKSQRQFSRAESLLSETLEKSSLGETEKLTVSLALCTAYVERLHREGALSSQNMNHAFELATQITKDHPNVRRGWLLLSELLIFKDPLQSLRALNKIEWLPSNDVVISVQPPSNYFATKLDLPMWLRLQKAHYSRTKALSMILPSNVPSGLFLRELIPSYLTEAQKEVYNVIVEMYKCWGWEQFLNYRSQVFLMKAEIEAQQSNVESNPRELKLSVTGMHCNSCKEKIENGIKDIESVASIEVDLEGKGATIQLEKDSTDELVETITKKIEELGFQASKATTTSHSAPIESEQKPESEENLENVSLDAQPKKLFCQQYIDHSIVALYSDLTSLTRLQESKETGKFDAVDWVFAGMLQRRLRLFDNAKESFEKSATLKQDVRGVQFLLSDLIHQAVAQSELSNEEEKIQPVNDGLKYSQADVDRSLQYVHKIVSCHFASLPQDTILQHATATEHIPPVVFETVYRLLEVVGISRVRETVEKIFRETQTSKLINDIILDALEWRSESPAQTTEE